MMMNSLNKYKLTFLISLLLNSTMLTQVTWANHEVKNLDNIGEEFEKEEEKKEYFGEGEAVDAELNGPEGNNPSVTSSHQTSDGRTLFLVDTAQVTSPLYQFLSNDYPSSSLNRNEQPLIINHEQEAKRLASLVSRDISPTNYDRAVSIASNASEAARNYDYRSKFVEGSSALVSAANSAKDTISTHASNAHETIKNYDYSNLAEKSTSYGTNSQAANKLNPEMGNQLRSAVSSAKDAAGNASEAARNYDYKSKFVEGSSALVSAVSSAKDVASNASEAARNYDYRSKFVEGSSALVSAANSAKDTISTHASNAYETVKNYDYSNLAEKSTSYGTNSQAANKLNPEMGNQLRSAVSSAKDAAGNASEAASATANNLYEKFAADHNDSHKTAKTYRVVNNENANSSMPLYSSLDGQSTLTSLDNPSASGARSAISNDAKTYRVMNNENTNSSMPLYSSLDGQSTLTSLDNPSASGEKFNAMGSKPVELDLSKFTPEAQEFYRNNPDKLGKGVFAANLVKPLDFPLMQNSINGLNNRNTASLEVKEKTSQYSLSDAVDYYVKPVYSAIVETYRDKDGKIAKQYSINDPAIIAERTRVQNNLPLDMSDKDVERILSDRFQTNLERFAEISSSYNTNIQTAKVFNPEIIDQTKSAAIGFKRHVVEILTPREGSALNPKANTQVAIISPGKPVRETNFKELYDESRKSIMNDQVDLTMNKSNIPASLMQKTNVVKASNYSEISFPNAKKINNLNLRIASLIDESNSEELDLYNAALLN